MKRLLTIIALVLMILWSWGLYAQAQDVEPSCVDAISAGSSHGLVIKDGMVLSWGVGYSGQLGNGGNASQSLPVQVLNMSDVKAVSAGGRYSLALKRDGTVYAWGKNTYGELGNGNAEDSNVPVSVAGLSDVKAISAGGEHSLALKSNGTVYAWGRNRFGQLGNDENGRLPVRIPVQVLGLNGVKAVSSGIHHSLALMNDGTVRAWGYNMFGELGNGTTEQSNVPIDVPDLSAVKAIYAGAYLSLALMEDGTVRAWGINYSGQLGNGNTEDSYVPVSVTGLSNVQAISAGDSNSYALMEDGTVRAWGINHSGQLGNGNTEDSNVPVTVTGLSDVKAVSAGSRHVLVFLGDGTVHAWGYNMFGELGNGTTEQSNVPIEVHGLSGITCAQAEYPAPNCSVAISTSSGGNLAIVENVVWKWGVENQSATYHSLPVEVCENGQSPDCSESLAGIKAVFKGRSSSFAITNSGELLAWGDNRHGQLGDGTTENRSTPIYVCEIYDSEAGLCTKRLSGIVSVRAEGNFYTLALREADGAVFAWGHNVGGQLGNNSTEDELIPIRVTSGESGEGEFLTDIKAISAGGFHALALASDGRVFAWGDAHQDVGLVGNGGYLGSLTPVQVCEDYDSVNRRCNTFLLDVSEVETGSYYSLVLKNNGDVLAWGSNSDGQLGIGNTRSKITPVRVISGESGDGEFLTGIKAISAGGYHALALANDNRKLFAWGMNEFGQLGNGTTVNQNAPVKVCNIDSQNCETILTGIDIIKAGSMHNIALRNGKILAWGKNNLGQLGDGTAGNGNISNIPIQVEGLNDIICDSGSAIPQGTLIERTFKFFRKLLPVRNTSVVPSKEIKKKARPSSRKTISPKMEMKSSPNKIQKR